MAGFARLAGLDWEAEVEEVFPVPVVSFSAGEGERLRLVTLAWGEVRESVALESVEFLRAGGGSFLMGAGESEPEESASETSEALPAGLAELEGVIRAQTTALQDQLASQEWLASRMEHVAVTLDGHRAAMEELLPGSRVDKFCCMSIPVI